jgi:hypothetical protein
MHFSDLFTACGALITNVGARAAGHLVNRRSRQHKIGAGLADFRAIDHQPEVIGLDMFSAFGEAVVHRRMKANAVTFQALIDAGLKVGRRLGIHNGT